MTIGTFSVLKFPRDFNKWNEAGVGNDFFPGGVQGVDMVLKIRGVGFGTQKLTNFDQNCNFSLI